MNYAFIQAYSFFFFRLLNCKDENLVFSALVFDASVFPLGVFWVCFLRVVHSVVHTEPVLSCVLRVVLRWLCS